MKNNTYLYLLALVTIYSTFSFGQYTSDTLDFKTIGNSSSQSYADICTLNDKFYAVGADNSCGNQDNFFAVYDNNLNLLNQHSIGSESFVEYATTTDTLLGKIYYGGVTNKDQVNGYNFVVGILDSNAFETNNKVIYSPEWSILNDILTSIIDSSIYCVGKTTTDYNQWQGKILKLDTALNTIWELEVGGIMDEDLVEICALNDSSFVAVGYSESNGAGAKDVYLVCFSDQGNIIWEQFIGGVNDDFGNSIIRTIDNGLAIFGTTASYNSTTEDTYLVKTDNLGNFQWSNLHQVQTANNTDEDRGMDLVQTSDGSYIVFAYVKSFGSIGVKDVRIMKTGSGGYWQGDTDLIGGADDEIVRAIAINDSTQVFVGSSKSYGFGNSDALIGLGTNLPFYNLTLSNTELIQACYTHIEWEQINNSFSFYPNPSEDYIYFEDEVDISKVCIFDLMGNLIIMNQSQSSSKIDVSSLSTGLYVVKYWNENELLSAKLIKK